MNMEPNEFNRCCQDFCKHPKPIFGLEGMVQEYPYFQIARLMSVYGRTQSAALAELAFLMEDRTFLYRFLSGKVRPDAMEEELSPLEMASAEIPKEISASEDGRTALEMLNEMLNRFKNEPNKPLDPDVSEEETYEDMGKSSNMERMNFVSETLARLYVEQKEYDRAIKVYKSLMEKQPEHKEAFAAAVESIKAMKNA